MHHVTGAGYLSGNREGCLRGTRKEVLWQIECWLADKTDQRVFWLNGLAGTGKSTIAQTFAETSFADGKLGASFFCSRDFEDRRDIWNIFPTLAFQLAYRYPEFREKLLPVLRANPEVGRESLCSQLEKLIIGPFKATGIPSLIIIDALDECKDQEPASAILSVLSRSVDQIPLVKFFITGRPEPRIRTGFRLELLRPITEVLKLHDVERSSVDADIKLFLGARLTNIAKTRSDCDFMESWPSPYDIDILCKKSAGLFIYASTVVKFVASPYNLPTERLTSIILLPQSTAHEGKSGIDLLYTQVLEQAFHDADTDVQELYSRFKLVLGAALLVFYPLSRKTLSELFKNCGTPSHISNTLRSLHSILLVPTREIDPIHPFHKSFPDFLTDPQRCRDERFFVHPPAHHIDILFSCLNLMKERMKKNICDLDGCPLLRDVKDLPQRRKAHIGSALEYACRFWTRHLSEIPDSGPHVEQVKAAIDNFFAMHLLFWIEVLSLTEHLDLSVYALHDIDRWYLLVSSAGYLLKHILIYLQIRASCKWTNDSERFILSNFDSIHDSPINVYRYIPFSPSSSWLHLHYTSESAEGTFVVKGRLGKWGKCTREVSFPHNPKALVCQKDIIVVGLDSGEIMILDAITGSRRSTLSGHWESVTSLAFSQDGTLLVSGSNDKTIKLWDIQTGGVIKTLYELSQVQSISISPDTAIIVSGSHDTIRLWGVRTGECISTHPVIGEVTSIKFLSAVSGHFMSVSGGHINEWDTNGRKAKPTISGHYVTFSSDGREFIVCDEGPPKVHYTISREIIATLHSPGLKFSHCCFSPSDKLVAGVANQTIYVWDMTSNFHLIETFTPDDSGISLLTYPLSLISMHIDGKIKFRRVDHDSMNSTARSTGPTGSYLNKIVYITLQAEENIAISVDLAGNVQCWNLSTGLSEITLQIPEVKDMGGAQEVNGILTLVYCDGPSLNDWNISTWGDKAQKKPRKKSTQKKPLGRRLLERKPLSGCLKILGPTIGCYDNGISEDGTTFFVINAEEIQTWSILTGESTGTLFHHNYTHISSPLSVDLDGSIMWICALDRLQAWGWDLTNMDLPPLSIPNRLHLAYLCDGYDASGKICQSRIIDTKSQTEIFRLPRQFSCLDKVQWDGRYLLAVSEGAKVLILDFVHMTLL